MKRLLAISFALAILSGCGNSELEESRIKLENIKDELIDVEWAMKELERAVEYLRKEVDDFSYENWRYNVPNVEKAAYEVENYFDNLKREINDVVSEL